MRDMWFLATLVLLQVFTFGLGRSLQWLFAPWFGKTGRRVLMAVSYFITNGLLFGMLWELGSMMFRVMALWMVFLLFVMYAAFLTFAVYLLLKKRADKRALSHGLRVFAPLCVAALLGFGVYNAYVPTVHRQTVFIDKPMAKPLRIGVASDLHLGVLFGARQLDKLAGIMQREQVDMVLLPGDLMDDNVDAYLRENMRPHLAKLTAPQGVYATLGNHDLFGDQARIRKELESAGVKVLLNQTVQGDGFLLLGRSDDMDASRPSAAALLAGQNTEQPVLLMDHRPTEILEHAKLPVDIQVSGHVHNGQIAPANLIVKTIYRLAYGYEQIGNTHFWVTSGYGFWGIPLRLGSQSEVWIIDIKSRANP